MAGKINLIRGVESVGPGNLQFILIPENQLVIVMVIDIVIPAQTCTLTDSAKGNLSQSTDFPHNAAVRTLINAALIEVDMFIIFGHAQ